MSSDTHTKIPTTLPAKQAKLMAFINYYHQQLVDNNIITERDSLDKFSGLFSQDITQQISFCNNFFDYESTHVKSYKEKTKHSKNNLKLQQKQNKKNDKLFLKSYNQLKDNKKWNNLLTKHTTTILNDIPTLLQNQDLRTQNPHTLLPLDTTKPLNTHPLYHILTIPLPLPLPHSYNLNISIKEETKCKPKNKSKGTVTTSNTDMVNKLLASND